MDFKPFITGRIALEDLVERGFDTLVHHKEPPRRYWSIRRHTTQEWAAPPGEVPRNLLCAISSGSRRPGSERLCRRCRPSRGQRPET